MRKSKKLYMVSHWCEARGTSRENPAYYLGAYNYISKELKNINPSLCYKTEATALRECAKLCTKYWWASVVEVPNSALRKDVA